MLSEYYCTLNSLSVLAMQCLVVDFIIFFNFVVAFYVC